MDRARIAIVCVALCSCSETVTRPGLESGPARPEAGTALEAGSREAQPPAREAGAVDAASPVWRPFSASSPWNTPIPQNPALEPDSAALIADFRTSSPYGEFLGVNIDGYSIPFFWADSATPTFKVLADIGGDGWVGTDGMNATATMPIPTGAAPDAESDHHLLIVDKQKHTEWGCWNMRNESGSWRAGLCATSDLSGSGVRVAATTGSPWYSSTGARACGFPLVAGLIRTEAIKAGRIDHALVVAYPHIRSGWFTPPASTGQGKVGTDAISTRGIPCGGRIQLDPSVNLDTLGVSAANKVILKALQEYGAYVGDYSGSLSLYAENSPAAKAYWGSGVLGSYELQNKLDLSKLRVIKNGQLYDYGNGN